MLWGAACTPSLVQGDRAFAEARYETAAALWETASDEDTPAVLFRRALLLARPGTPTYDPARASAELDTLRRLDPAGPYGTAAALALDTLRRLEVTTTRLGQLDTELVRCLDVRDEQRRTCDEQLATRDAAVTAAEEDRQRLAAEVKTLREATAELQTLRDEVARLKEELEEMKRIDLRE